MICSVSEHVTSTTVPAITGNCVVVSIVLVHSVFSPVHVGAVGDWKTNDMKGLEISRNALF